ncbi:inositol oxygenase [Syncephalastrum racemosum]|uniref:Inositol oxygenase n=1 Tax=Syncephalastrum racemosum TaxID=13706 RepID=A0A1X2HQ74_SYNRA|nr:inositol oxygenase [Syncephalastrum racemosum]
MRVVLSEAARVTEAWEDFVHQKYAGDHEQATHAKDKADFRDYTTAEPTVAAFYKENHEKQTLEHVLAMKAKYGALNHARMGIWECLEVLNGLVDESDPDTSLPQTAHALQSAEAARRDGQPRWMILVALIHDLGKYLFFMDNAQWTVVGDTFPVGCAHAPKVVHNEYFANNPDTHHPVYGTQYGIYEPHCGLDNVHMSFGHDEYMYMVCKDYLPREALYILRFHSFYPCHTEHEYQHLMNEEDHKMMKWVNEFNKYDLYSKDDDAPDTAALKPYYEELIAEYFPEKINW